MCKEKKDRFSRDNCADKDIAVLRDNPREVSYRGVVGSSDFTRSQASWEFSRLKSTDHASSHNQTPRPSCNKNQNQRKTMAPNDYYDEDDDEVEEEEEEEEEEEVVVSKKRTKKWKVS